MGAEIRFQGIIPATRGRSLRVPAPLSRVVRLRANAVWGSIGLFFGVIWWAVC